MKTMKKTWPIPNSNEDVTLGVARYGRYWAIMAGDILLAVTVYLKGAKSVISYINDLRRRKDIQQKASRRGKEKAKKTLKILTSYGILEKGQNTPSITNMSKKNSKYEFSTENPDHTHILLRRFSEEEINELELAHPVSPAYEECKAEVYQSFRRLDERLDKIQTRIDKTKHTVATSKNKTTIRRARQRLEEEERELGRLRDEDKECRIEAFTYLSDQLKKCRAKQEPEQEPMREPTTPKLRDTKKEAVCQIIPKGETEPRAILETDRAEPGTYLLRKYNKEEHQVYVERDGTYSYRGVTYPTLTHISWIICPYKISGNTFFGLPVKKRKG